MGAALRIFTPLSAADAESATRGTLRGDSVWFDAPVPQEADPDAVWVGIDMPGNRMARFERPVQPGAGHREFLLPARIINLYRPQVVRPPVS